MDDVTAKPDGGEPYLDWNLDAHNDLGAQDRTLLQGLGGAVVTRWDTLPRDVQKALFEAAVAGAPDLKGAIARFLHSHAAS